MNFRLIAIWSITVILHSYSGIVYSSEKEMLKRVEQHFPQTIERLYEDYKLRGDFMIALVDPDGLRYVFTLNPKGTNSKVNGLTVDTPFLIASHTKALTGTLAKLLGQQGKLGLEEPIGKYLTDVIQDPRIDMNRITVSNLLNHTAGFTSTLHTFKLAFLGYKDQSDLDSALNKNMLVAPSNKFRYSNTGPILAAQIMERITEHRWQDLMRTRLFDPLNMHHTSAYLNDYAIDEVLPSIEVASDGGMIRAGLHKTNKTLHASGGIISTLSDMAKWLQFNLSKGQKLGFPPEFFIKLHEPTVEQDKRYFTYDRYGYSLAWDIANYHGKKMLTRFGGYGGISFHASFIPSEELAVISFFNDERGYVLPHLAANYIYNLVLEPAKATERYEQEAEIFKSSFERESARTLKRQKQVSKNECWEGLLGQYESEEGWPSIKLFVKNDNVWMRWGVLSGPIFSNAEGDGSYIVALGPIRRTIKIIQHTDGITELHNGSLIFFNRNMSIKNMMEGESRALYD